MTMLAKRRTDSRAGSGPCCACRTRRGRRYLALLLAGAALAWPGAIWASTVEIDWDETVDGILVTYLGGLVVGSVGTGSLSIINAGEVANTWGTLGMMPGAHGTVTVAGAGSTWNNSGNLTVGLDGTGTLTIADGGRVTNAEGYVGSEPTSQGTVTVTGTDSLWSNSGSLGVGSAGNGTLTIAEGAWVTNPRASIPTFPS